MINFVSYANVFFLGIIIGGFVRGFIDSRKKPPPRKGGNGQDQYFETLKAALRAKGVEFEVIEKLADVCPCPECTARRERNEKQYAPPMNGSSFDPESSSNHH